MTTAPLAADARRAPGKVQQQRALIERETARARAQMREIQDGASKQDRATAARPR
jgi:hypothetical protein